MKTKKVSPAPAATGVQGQAELHDAHHPDHFKEQQKLPSLSGLIEEAARIHLVPANELDFADFYHL